MSGRFWSVIFNGIWIMSVIYVISITVIGLLLGLFGLIFPENPIQGAKEHLYSLIYIITNGVIIGLLYDIATRKKEDQ